MHDDYRLNYTQPIGALGPLVKKQEPERVCEFREFETKVYGAASAGQLESARAATVSEPCAAPPPTGKWVEWNGAMGAACPVPADSLVEIRWWDGVEREYRAFCVCGWDGPSIVAYRILP